MEDKGGLRWLSGEGLIAIILGLVPAVADMNWLLRTLLVILAIGFSCHLAWRISLPPILRALIAMAAVVALIGFTWHPIWDDFHKAYPMFKIEPIHLIAFGASGAVIFAVIAVGGVAWQMSRPQMPALAPGQSFLIAEGQPTNAAVWTDSNPEHQALFKRTAELSKGNKEKLSDLLFELSRAMDKAPALLEHAMQVRDTLRNAANRGELAKRTQEYINITQALSVESGKFRESIIPIAQAAYFREQVLYVLGPDPNKSDMIRAAADSYTYWLATWNQVQNKTDPAMSALLQPAMDQFDQVISNFNGWIQECRPRFDDIRRAVERSQ